VNGRRTTATVVATLALLGLVLAGCSSNTPMREAQARMDAAETKRAATVRVSLKGTPWDREVAAVTVADTAVTVWVNTGLSPADAADLASSVAQAVPQATRSTWVVEVLDPGGQRLAVHWNTSP
jgi:hypothetical protein